MGKVDDLTTYVNENLPLRGVTYISSLLGYSGDPNDGAAPSALQSSPPGTSYLNETGPVWYRKTSSGATGWQVSVENAHAASHEIGGSDPITSLDSLIVGSAADSADFPNALVIISQDDTTATSSDVKGLSVETSSDGVDKTVSFLSIANANGTRSGTAISAIANVTNSADIGGAVAGLFGSYDTHAGGDNVAGNFYAANGANNYAIKIYGGDINQRVSAGWELPDNTAAALDFKAGVGGNSILVLDTTDDAEQVRVGNTAASADFPNARAIISNGDTTRTSSNIIGLIAEAQSDGTATANAVYAVGRTSGSENCQAIYGKALVGNTADTGAAVAASFAATTAHTGGTNIAVAASAANGDTNYAIQISAGDVIQYAAADWDLPDNEAEALSFDTTGHTGLLVLDTTDDAEQVRVGDTAASADFPNAKMIVSNGDTGYSLATNFGVVGEAVGGGGEHGFGVYGFGMTNGAARGVGTAGFALITATGDTADAIGGYFLAAQTHAGGRNIGLTCGAAGGATNIALENQGGDYLQLASADWDLPDNEAAALSFDSAGASGIMTIVTTDDEEKVMFGSTASAADFTNTAGIFSNGDTGYTSTSTVGLFVEAASTVGSNSNALISIGTTAGASPTTAIWAQAKVDATGDTADAVGASLSSFDTHAGGDNIGATVYASGGDNNYALKIQGGDVLQVAAMDWDLPDNEAEALSFDTTGHAGLLVLDTTDDAEMVRIGATAASADFPNARAIISQADTTWTDAGIVGLVVEAVADSIGAYAVNGVATAEGAYRGYGILGKGKVTATGDTAGSYGGHFISADTHAGGDNVAVSGYAADGANNYALQIQAGDIDSSLGGYANVGVDWDLLDNNSEALSFDTTGHTGLLVLDTTDDAEQVRVGTTALSVSYPLARFVSSQAATGYTLTTTECGVVGEAIGSGTGNSGIGVAGIAAVNGSIDAYGLSGSAKVATSTDTGDAIGVAAWSFDTHAGGDNVAIVLYASGGDSNYAIDNQAGDFKSVEMDWDLVDDTAAALSFDTTGKTGMLVFDTTDTAEKLTTSVPVEGAAGIAAWGVSAPSSQPTKISDPSGGTTTDAEARTAINAILDVLEGAGLAAST